MIWVMWFAVRRQRQLYHQECRRRVPLCGLPFLGDTCGDENSREKRHATVSLRLSIRKERIAQHGLEEIEEDLERRCTRTRESAAIVTWNHQAIVGVLSQAVAKVSVRCRS